MNSSPSKAELLERERRGARTAGLLALAGVLVFAAGTVVQAGGLGDANTDAERLVEIHENSRVILGQALSGAAIVLFAFPLLFLFRAAAARAERVRTTFTALIVAGPLLLGLAQVMTAVGSGSAADEFVQGEATAQATTTDADVGGKEKSKPADETTVETTTETTDRSTTDETTTDSGDSSSDDEENSPEEDRAEDALNDDTLVTVGRAVGLAGVLSMIFGLVYTSLWALRTGLLTRFWGSLGMAVGASMILLGLFGVVLWFAVVGLQLAGFWPRPRPPAWEAGTAVPWPAPGQLPEDPGPGSSGPGGTVEGEGREVAPQPSDQDEPERPSELGPPPRKRKRRN